MRAGAAVVVLAGMLAVLALAPAAGMAGSASTTVNVTVGSATTLLPGTCVRGAAGITDLGTLFPLDERVTSTDCTLTWGSSNDTASLHAIQHDRAGSAMWRPADGTPKAGFGTGGVLTQDYGEGGVGDALGRGAAMTRDGKLLGFTFGYDTGDWSLTQLLATGAPDSGFATGGRLTVPGTSNVRDMAVAADGDIFLVGYHGGNFHVARATSAGSLVGGFGTAGLATIDFGGANDNGETIAMQADGKAVVAGYSNASGEIDFAVARLTTTGAPDPTFGGGDGMVTVDIGATDEARGVAVLADGRILLAGRCTMATTDACTVVLRSDGSLDPDWSGDGIGVYTVGGGSDYTRSVALATDGKVLLGGYYRNGSYDPFVLRIDPATGELDTTFDGDGRAVVAATPLDDYIYDVSVQGDDGIVLVGSVVTGGTSLVLRFTRAGVLDPTFGTGGMLQPDMFAGAEEALRAVSVGVDGQLVATGSSSGTTDDDTAMLWLGSTTVPDYGTGSWTGGGGVFAACLRATGAGVTEDWTVAATCTAGDGAAWRGIADDPLDVGYRIARTSAPGTSTVSLRFGMKPGSSQRAGSYVAPIEFVVVAPAI